MEGRSEQSPKNLLQRAVRLGRRVLDVFDPTLEKVVLDQIDERKVAEVICQRLGNPIQERLNGNRWANPFSVGDVIEAMEVPGFWDEGDHYRKHPDYHQKCSQALRELVRDGVLEMIGSQEPDLHNEIVFYKVKDQNRLRELGQHGESSV